LAPSDPTAQADTLLICLEELCRIHKRPRSGSALKASLPLTNGRLNVDSFLRAAKRGNLDATLTKLPLEKLLSEALPLVLLDTGGEACLMLPDKQGNCRVWDAHSKTLKDQSQAELQTRYSGQAILLFMNAWSSPANGSGVRCCAIARFILMQHSPR
jgi:ATP-binding cassette, subfamily C, bacterial LapB